VYDNASGDETGAVVRALAEADPRVKYHCHPENIGVFKNFLYAMERVETPFFSILSDDDILLPSMYGLALANLEKFPDAMISVAPTIGVNEQGRVWFVATTGGIAGLHAPPEAMLSMLEHEQPPIWTGMLFRREVLEKVGSLDAKTGHIFDLDFQLRVAARFPIVTSLEPGAILMTHPASKSLTVEFEERAGSWLELIRKMSSDEAIPLRARTQAAHMLNDQLRTWLLLCARSFIVGGEWGKTEKTINMLRNYCYLGFQPFLLSVVARTCRSVPPIQVLLKGLRFFKRWVVSMLPDPRGKQLERTYGDHVGYLRLYAEGSRGVMGL
jgi:glycosyltransferase involved in cell wall biosynthesis